MTSPEFGASYGRPRLPTAGPCAPARAEVDVRCADAERLLAAAKSHQDALRDARRQHSEASRLRESDEKLRDRRRLAEEKTAAQAEYHALVTRATNLVSVQDAAAAWLHRVDELNRESQVADERADGLAKQVNELERVLPGLELTADAARIAAESAQVVCLESRRELAACQEASQRHDSSTTAGQPATAPEASTVPEATTATEATEPPDPSPAMVVAADPPPTEMTGVETAASALMRGDRQTLLGLALRLADETGFEAGRLQLLLLELREQIERRALDEFAFAFPHGHPFWSQFTVDTARGVAASLASMGYRFDGADGWTDAHSPQIRDLALALSYCGYDPRTLRRPAGQAAIDALWQGTMVQSEEYLLSRAPDMELPQIVAVLGQPSGHLAELWDIWGRLRPLLMRTVGAPA